MLHTMAPPTLVTNDIIITSGRSLCQDILAMGGSEEAVLMVCRSHDVCLIVIWIKSGAVYELKSS